MLGVAAVETQPDALAPRHDLAQPAGVGDDAGAAGGHRLERHQPERLIDRRHHAEIGDPVERVQRVVADPAQEAPVRVQAQPPCLLLQLLSRGCRCRRPRSARRRPARSRRAERRAPAGSPSHRRAARPAARASRAASANSRRSACEVAHGLQFARVDPVGNHRDAALVDVEDVGHVAAHVVGADDHGIRAPGHPALDGMDVRLRSGPAPSPGGARARWRGSSSRRARPAGRRAWPRHVATSQSWPWIRS